MVSAGFTPGPYSLDTASNGEIRVQGRHAKIIARYSRDQEAMAEVHCRRLQSGHVKAERLIRDAAPELYAAVEDALAFVEDAISWCTDSELGPLIDRRERYSAALAKAIGA